jgi:RNA polymerase sigma factor (sigma-70 family)
MANTGHVAVRTVTAAPQPAHAVAQQATGESPATIDAELVGRSQTRDPQALADLLRLSRPLVQRTVRRAYADCPSQEDVVQTVLADVVAEIDRLRSPRAFVAWILGITHNVCRKEIARRSRARHRLQPLASIESTVPSPFIGPEEAAVRLGLHDILGDAIDALPSRYRTALLMRAVDGRSYEEIGATLEVSPDLARLWSFRARRRLQRDLHARVAPRPRHAALVA